MCSHLITAARLSSHELRPPPEGTKDPPPRRRAVNSGSPWARKYRGSTALVRGVIPSHPHDRECVPAPDGPGRCRACARQPRWSVRSPAGPDRRRPGGPTYGMILGQVVDARGAPVPEAIIRLSMPRYLESLATTPKGRVMADSEGRFCFADLPAALVHADGARIGRSDSVVRRRPRQRRGPLLVCRRCSTSSSGLRSRSRSATARRPHRT
jgi:hypothetical protein